MSENNVVSPDSLTGYFESASRQPQFYPTHLSLLMAMVCYCNIDNPILPFNISRKKLMRFSRIKSIATYHKNIKDLIRYGFITYNPSSHPKLGSEVRLIFNDCEC